MKPIFILPYVRCPAAWRLRDALGAKFLIVDPNKDFNIVDKVVINYGFSLPWQKRRFLDRGGVGVFLNFFNPAHPGPQNKLNTFRRLEGIEGVNIPDFTTSTREALNWQNAGHTVLARTSLHSFAGNNIVIVKPGEEMPQVPLYVKYKKKRKEFRVHVFNGQVLHVQEKRRRRDAEVNNLIRSHRFGWVFCNENIVEPEDLRDQALKAVSAFPSLYFAGIDIIWNEAENKSYVLELNSAPGLEGITLGKYKEAFFEVANRD